MLSLVLFLVAGFYTARKRLLQERVGGTMMAWLKSHIYLGGAALVVAVAHWLLGPVTTDFTSGKLAILLLAILVLSGLAWRLVYLRVPPKVPATTGNLSIRDSRERASDHRIEIDKVKVGRSSAFQRAVDELVNKTRTPAELASVVATFEESERDDWTRVEQLASNLQRESMREVRQRRYARLLQAWRVVHLPLALAALGAIGFHLYDVFNVSRAFSGEVDNQFASSEDCASCHADIVDEWKLSPHRMAQTSTITRAQTSMALETNPDFRKDCVNCHAPIGTKASDETTFPVGQDPGLNPTSAGTEGITCVVCHTMEEHPEELAGFTDDLPIGQRSALGLGEMFGPPLEDPGPRPNSVHDIGTGFMTDPISSSQLCGTCHNVVADVDGNGIAPAGSDSAPQDSDEDQVLDENEINADEDLVLQTTFNEWEDFLFAQGGVGPSCVDCHMPLESGPVGTTSPLVGTPERDRNAHTFPGVDYELDTDYYEQPGMPPGALSKVLQYREDLLSNAVDLTVAKSSPEKGVLRATVRIENRAGHSFPTGFAFARQFWLEVSATSSSGEPVCLLDVQNIESPCASGEIAEADEDLATCNVQPIAEGDVEVRMIAISSVDDCDPWLVNFQKILTDADRDNDEVFEEVPYQSKTGEVVKDRFRTVDDPKSGDAQVMDEIPQRRSTEFAYEFDIADIGNDSVSVKVVLRHRHLAPYFVRALQPFFEEDDPTAEELLANMTVVDVASNLPLGDTRTSPSVEALAAVSRTRPVEQGSSDSGPWAALPLLALIGGAAVFRKRAT